MMIFTLQIEAQIEATQIEAQTDSFLRKVEGKVIKFDIIKFKSF